MGILAAKLRSLLDEVYANAREDAATAIGNGNQRTLHTDITEITLSLTVHSLGDYEGKTVVTISPAARTLFPIRYTYGGPTWHCGAGTTVTLYPIYTVNGVSPASVHVL